MTDSTSLPEVRPGHRAHRPLGLHWIVLGTVCLLFSHRALVWSSRASSSSASALDEALYAPSMTAPALALSAFALLVFHRRARIAKAYRDRVGSGWGLAPLGFGVALLLWSEQISADRLLMPSLILQLSGAALAIGGRALLQALGMPLLALATAVALPPQIIQELVFSLQLWTVSLSSFLLDLVGCSHEVEGDLVLYRGDRFQVIEGCSGFKSTVSLVLAAIVYADRTVRGPWAKASVIALAVPIGILMNAVRVTILITGRIPSDSDAHTTYGILAIVVGVVVLALVELTLTRIGIFASGKPTTNDGSAAARAGLASASCGVRPRNSIALLVISSTVLVAVVPRGSWPSPSPAINIETLPFTIGGRTAESIRVDDAWLGSVWFGHRIYRSYDANPTRAGSVRVFIGHEDVTTAERTGFSPKTFIPRSGWRSFVRRPAVEIAAGLGAPEVGRRWVIEYPDRSTLVQQWRTGFAPWGWEVSCRWLGLDRAGIFGKLRSPLVIRIELDVDARVRDERRGWMILRQFATSIEMWRARPAA